MGMGQVSAPLPKWKCHKEVYAVKIKEIVRDADVAHSENRDSDGSAMITPDDSRFLPFRVDRDYVNKHRPEAGGYFVVYEDGYRSFSPAKAFEDGYTLIQ